MNNETIQTIYQFIIAGGIILTAIGGLGSYYYGQRLDNDKSAPAPISIPLVDLELKRVEADPNLAHWKIEFAYDILIHNKSSVPISKIKIRRQIDSNKNKQKLALHGYAQNKLKFFQEDINVLGSKEFKKIHREHSKSYEYAIFTITYQDEFNKRYKCIFEGDRDSVHLRNCALQDNEAQNST